jgi:hypothetical protein
MSWPTKKPLLVETRGTPSLHPSPHDPQVGLIPPHPGKPTSSQRCKCLNNTHINVSASATWPLKTRSITAIVYTQYALSQNRSYFWPTNQLLITSLMNTPPLDLSLHLAAQYLVSQSPLVVPGNSLSYFLMTDNMMKIFSVVAFFLLLTAMT